MADEKKAPSNKAREIKGRLVAVAFGHPRQRQPLGWHIVKAVTVERNRRDEIKRLVVRVFNPLTERYNGKRVVVRPDEWRSRMSGVLWRKGFVPLEEFGKEGAAK